MGLVRLGSGCEGMGNLRGESVMRRPLPLWPRINGLGTPQSG